MPALPAAKLSTSMALLIVDSALRTFSSFFSRSVAEARVPVAWRSFSVLQAVSRSSTFVKVFMAPSVNRHACCCTPERARGLRYGLCSQVLTF